MKRVLSLLLSLIISGLFPCFAFADVVNTQNLNASASQETNLNANPQQVLQSITKDIVVPESQSIPLLFDNPVNSKSIMPGDMVSIVANDDVFIDNVLVFKKGTRGVAYVDEAKSARAFGRPGLITIRSGKIADVFGNQHIIKISAYAKGNSSKSAVILPIISLIILWPLAFFAFKKGEEVSIPQGKIYFGYTTAPVTVKI